MEQHSQFPSASTLRQGLDDPRDHTITVYCKLFKKDLKNLTYCKLSFSAIDKNLGSSFYSALNKSQRWNGSVHSAIKSSRSTEMRTCSWNINGSSLSLNALDATTRTS